MLRPPSHRGPLIATGAVVLTVGLALTQLRYDDLEAGWQLLISASAAALMLWLSVASPLEGGRPPAFQSVLLVCGLGHLFSALVELAEVLGADGFEAGPMTLVSAALAAAAGVLADRRNSGIAALVSALAGVAALLFLADWAGDPEIGTFRALLLIAAVALVVVSLVLRGSRPRHSEQLVNAAGLSILAIGLTEIVSSVITLFGGVELPGFWELVLLAAGFGLIAYAAADRAPGPAYLGAANLAAFAAVTTIGSERTLQWWPFALLATGGFILAAGLRPLRPLPPEPSGYARGDVPLHSRAVGEDGERTFTVRD